MVYDAMSFSLEIAPKAMDAFPKLKAHRKRFEELPKIMSYLETEQGKFNCYALRAQDNLERVQKL